VEQMKKILAFALARRSFPAAQRLMGSDETSPARRAAFKAGSELDLT
jgi:hypothetical protein